MQKRLFMLRAKCRVYEWKLSKYKMGSTSVQGRITWGAIATGPPLQGRHRDDVYLF